MNDHQHHIVINEVVKLLQGGSAHATLQDALNRLSPDVRGVKPDKLPYSIWQLVEHIRIAQWDMLQFSKDANHQSPKWPDEYWPKESGPESEDAWNRSVQQINSDLEEFIELVKQGDLYQNIPHGHGQTLLREALQIADHTGYHAGEIIVIRRLLGDYPPAT